MFFQACIAIAKTSGAWGPSEKSQLFWEHAATRPLNIVPGVKDQDVSEDMGPAFLREYEASKRTIVAPLKKEATTDSKFSKGVDSLKRSDISSDRGMPVTSERSGKPNITATSKETTPRGSVARKKQPRLDFFFKKAAKKANGDSPSDEIPGDDVRMDSAPYRRTQTSGDIHESLEQDDKNDIKDTAQGPALGSTQNNSKSAESNSPVVDKRRPGLKRKAGEEL